MIIRKCVICGRGFPTYPSRSKITCSRECFAIRAHRTHLGKHNVWSPEAKQRLQERAETAPTGRNKYIWVLLSPEGERIEVINLLGWARNHAKDYFGVEPTDVNAQRIASGIHQLKRSQEGKVLWNGHPVTLRAYKGWKLLDYRKRDDQTK